MDNKDNLAGKDHSDSEDENSPLTIWGAVDTFAQAILKMQQELRLIKNALSDQQITLEKGKELPPDKYEANFKLGKEINIATLPRIGYYMLNDELVIRNHITAKECKIPKEFHYLKVVEPYQDSYKLTFCDWLGNDFFEYKKYDPQYSDLPDEYRFVDFGSMKKAHNIKFKKHIGHAPIFRACEGHTEPESQKHIVDLFGLFENDKDKKVGVLTDEFGYIDGQNNLNYCNYHNSKDSNTYDPSEFIISRVSTIKSGIDTFYLTTEQSKVSLNPILENLDIL